MARRMENYFWRIWSNRNINRAISGETVSRLFENVASGASRIQPTPTTDSVLRQAPQEVETPSNTSASQQSESHTLSTHSTTRDHDSNAATPQASSSSAVTSQPMSTRHLSDSSHSFPAPILKKSPTIPFQHPTSSHSRSTTTLTIDPTPLVIGGPSHVSQSVTSPQRLQRTSSSQTERRKGGSSGGKSKTRPAIGRKRSGQGTVPLARKSPTTSPRIQPRRERKSEETIELLDSGPSNTSTFALPSGSWQDESSPSQSQEIGMSTTHPSSWLVDKNFRDKFAEHQKRASSHTNIPNLVKSSSVRFMDELPERSKGKQRYSEVDTYGNVVRSEMQQEGSSRQEEGGSDGEVAVDDEAVSPSVLPRTKSQLSMMIDRQRRLSGSLGPDPPPTADENVDPVRPSTTSAEDDDEEYFVMGMGVGQTKVRTSSFKDKGKGRADEPFDGHSPSSGPTW